MQLTNISWSSDSSTNGVTSGRKLIGGVCIFLGVLWMVLLTWWVKIPFLLPRDHSPAWQALVSGFNEIAETFLFVSFPEIAVFVAAIWPGVLYVAVGIVILRRGESDR